MGMKKNATAIAFFLFLFIFLFTPSIANATDVTECIGTSGAGYYRLINDIFVDTDPMHTGNSCIDIANHNVVFDLNDYGIYSRNQTFLSGILVRGNIKNVTIMNGFIGDFLNISTNDMSAITVSCGGYECRNITISNVKISNSSIGIYLRNVTDLRISGSAFDVPNGKFGIWANYIYNSSINAFARANTYALVLGNSENSFISGHYDTNVITTIEKNITGIDLINIITLGLIPARVIGTETVQKQAEGLGIYIYNNSNVVFQDVSAIGLIQGIYVKNSNKNTFARIDLPLSNKKSGGKFGGLYLDPTSIENILCEVTGLIIDDCNQLILTSTCASKKNYYFDSCANVFLNTTFGYKEEMQNIFLTPLIPQLTVPEYPFITFITTPFFLSMFVATGISIGVAIKTNAKFGVYTLLILVSLLAMVQLSTFWFSFIFVVIMGVVLLNIFKKPEIIKGEKE
jgi:hypothetical protein